MIDVCIVTPAYDGRVHDDHARSVEAGRELLRQHGISSARRCLRGDAVLPRVRNQCVAEALTLGAKQIVFVDSDIGFDAPMLLRLVSHDAPLVGCAPQAQLRNWRDAASPRCVWVPKSREGRTDARSLVEARSLATGFMKVHSDVFRALVAAGKARKYIYPGMAPENWQNLATYFYYDLVPIDALNDPALAAQCDAAGVPQADRLMFQGEDYYFCDRAREVGFDSFLDAGLRCRHWEGRVCHDYSIMEAMQASAVAAVA